MVLEGKMKMIDVSNSFIFEEHGGKHSSTFFISLLDPRCNGHAFFSRSGEKSEIPVVNGSRYARTFRPTTCQ